MCASGAPLLPAQNKAEWQLLCVVQEVTRSGERERENSLEDHLSADVRGEPEQRSRVFSPKENYENKIEMFEVQRRKEKRREPFSGYKCICFQTSVKKL